MAAIVIALLLSAPWAALGLAIGLGMAIVNFRFLDAGVAKLHTEGETNNKVLRRAMGTKSVTRLGVITVIAIGLMFLNGALGSAPWPGWSSSSCSSCSTSAAWSCRRGSSEHRPSARPAATSPSATTTAWCTWRASPSTWTSSGPRSSPPPSCSALGLRMRAKVTSGVPGKLQLFWETLVEQVSDLADSAIGPEGLPFVGLGVTVFFFILICNWLAFVPSGDPGFLAPPTGDVNLPLALALTVFFLVHYNSVKARGWKGYFKHYASPTPR